MSSSPTPTSTSTMSSIQNVQNVHNGFRRAREKADKLHVKTAISLSSNHLHSETWELAEELFRNESRSVIIATLTMYGTSYDFVLSRQPFTDTWIRSIVKSSVCTAFSQLSDIADGRESFAIECKNQCEMANYTQHFRDLVNGVMNDLSHAL
jgi:hypothetical protein